MEIINNVSRKTFNEEEIHTVKDGEKIRSILSRTENSNVFGEETLPTVMHKAVKLFYEIASSQAFHHGNKRTSLLSFSLFLKYNYLVFDHEKFPNNKMENYLYNLSKDVANKK